MIPPRESPKGSVALIHNQARPRDLCSFRSSRGHRNRNRPISATCKDPRQRHPLHRIRKIGHLQQSRPTVVRHSNLLVPRPLCLNLIPHTRRDRKLLGIPGGRIVVLKIRSTRNPIGDRPLRGRMRAHHQERSRHDRRGRTRDRLDSAPGLHLREVPKCKSLCRGDARNPQPGTKLTAADLGMRAVANSRGSNTRWPKRSLDRRRKVDRGIATGARSGCPTELSIRIPVPLPPTLSPATPARNVPSPKFLDEDLNLARRWITGPPVAPSAPPFTASFPSPSSFRIGRLADERSVQFQSSLASSGPLGLAGSHTELSSKPLSVRFTTEP